MTYLIAIAIGYVAGIYRNDIFEKAKDIYVKYSNK